MESLTPTQAPQEAKIALQSNAQPVLAFGALVLLAIFMGVALMATAIMLPFVLLMTILLRQGKSHPHDVRPGWRAVSV